jgi:copper chaperone CopZ
MRQETFRVREIHCGGCERAISNSLDRLEGIEVVEPDQTTNEVRVSFDETVIDPETIGARLADAGFPLTE